MAERVDYYSEGDYQQALMMEDAQREQDRMEQDRHEQEQQENYYGAMQNAYDIGIEPEDYKKYCEAMDSENKIEEIKGHTDLPF